MNKNTLVFHIGTCKTGTTSLQYFLYRNNAQLKKYGWSYPDLSMLITGEQDFRNGETTFYELNRYKREFKLNIGSEKWDNIWKILKNELKEYSVIVSSEDFWDFYTEELLTAARKEYENIKVIVYLRRQDHFIESWWNQSIKADNICDNRSLEDFFEEERLADRYDYISRINKISNIVGGENIIVRPYEKGAFKGKKKDIISDFLFSLGIDINWDEFEITNDLNKRLNGNMLEIRRILNQEYDVERYSEIVWRANGYFDLLNDIESDKNYVYLSMEQRTAFLEQFKRGNEEIARKYLKREDGVLFYEEIKDLPVYIPKETEFEKDIIRVFSRIALEQELEIHRLQNQIENNNKLWEINQKEQEMFYNQLLSIIRRGVRANKKIIIYGAGNNAATVIRVLNVFDYHPEMIVDGNIDKDGIQINGIPVVYTEKITDWESYLVVVSVYNSEEIQDMLEEKGLDEGTGYILAKNYIIL